MSDKEFVVHPSMSRERSYTECVAELEREIQVRKRCFERWIAEGKIDRCTATDRFERLKGVLQFMAPKPESENGDKPF